jgi:hypothetical protein
MPLKRTRIRFRVGHGPSTSKIRGYAFTYQELKANAKQARQEISHSFRGMDTAQLMTLQKVCA